MRTRSQVILKTLKLEKLSGKMHMVAKTMYLVTLKFRVYPLSLSLSNPNELSQELTPLDGALAFAEYYQDKLSKMPDWRVQYLEDTLISDRLEWKSKIRSSYLLPAVSKGKTIEILTPMGFRAVFKIDSKAHYEFSQEKRARHSESSQIFLRLGRRDDIIKAEILRRSLNIELTRKTKALPSSASGPYKAIDYIVKFNTPNLMWASIVEGISKEKLEEVLAVLKIFGIGKKRNMGWGDILNYCIHPLKDKKMNSVTSGYIVHNENLLETWRPWSPERLTQLIQNKEVEVEYKKFSLLDSKIGYGAERPPYWRKSLVIKSALFQIS